MKQVIPYYFDHPDKPQPTSCSLKCGFPFDLKDHSPDCPNHPLNEANHANPK